MLIIVMTDVCINKNYSFFLYIQPSTKKLLKKKKQINEKIF